MINKILIISRNYPPMVGGLEAYSYELIRQFQKNTNCRKITLSKSKKHLVWFYPFCLLKSLWMVRRYNIPFVHLCDGLLAPIGIFLKSFAGVQVTVTIHGLDVTYGNRIYQHIIPYCIGKMNGVICPSRSTALECRKRGISPEKTWVVPNGIRPETVKTPLTPEACRDFLSRMTGAPLKGKKVLTTIGRLVKRKGVSWFIEQVIPELDEDHVYVVAGDGPDRTYCETLVASLQLENRVFFLGSVTDEERNSVYYASDIFIMPNIFVENDVEGFGIVALEAGATGLPVVATDIQGIRDAVVDKETGFLIQEKDTEGFVRAIEGMDLDKSVVRDTVQKNYSWEKIVMNYMRIIESVGIPVKTMTA